VILSGLHIGCFELFGNQRIRSVRDLKGKQVAVTRLTSGRHIFLSVMAAHVGLDPRKDINWVTNPVTQSMQLFADGKIDAFMGFPPEPQELRAKRSATLSSTQHWIDLGPSTSVAWSSAIGNSFGNIPWQPNGCYGQS
jgi:ABC-type nitrate/sulfonate/bicarbonate transport system substrate-binding protein